MPSEHPFGLEAASVGLSAPHVALVEVLGTTLDQVVREQAGEAVWAQVVALRQACVSAAHTPDPSRRLQAEADLAALPLESIVWLLRTLTAFFHLVNQAERQEIIRINRERQVRAVPEAPRADSIEEAVVRLKQQGCTTADVQALLGRLDIQPTLTAHPTEARRRSILYKQQRLSELLDALRQPQQTPDEAAEIRAELHSQIALLLATSEVRSERVSVAEEVEYGLYFLNTTIWDVVPRIHADVRRALERHYGLRADLPGFLRFRTWIGGDRDGNPFVTPEVTRQAAALLRRTILTRYQEELRLLRRELSLSDRYAPVPEGLRASVAADAATVPLEEREQRAFQHEPYRLKLSYMQARIAALLDALDGKPTRVPPTYTWKAFVGDLEGLQEWLAEARFGEAARAGRLASLLARARSFGFHFAALDIRQHSRLHEEATGALLHVAGVTDAYATLSEAQRQALLTQELANPRPLLPHGAALPETARMVLDTFGMIRDLKAQDPEAVGSFIISMTHTLSDVLEVLLLAKEVGLWRLHEGAVASALDVAPLFETIEDLALAESFLHDLFQHPVYQRHLVARGRFQEIMLGYSDSNKDGGFWMANWALHQAQERIGAVCHAHDLDFRLFHGRGGTVGRGGGRASLAILAMPPAAQSGRIRFTEQGEVISFRYALPDIAHRHLEQIVHAMLLATGQAHTPASPPLSDADTALMQQVADASMHAYRALIDDPALWPWYTRITPIEHISRLPIASRPVSRKSGQEVDFESLRAIPWVFAWTQTRYTVPGWYGIGHALQTVLAAAPTHLALMQDWYARWPFFQAVVGNAQLEMARARLDIARHYTQLGEPATHLHDRIAADFAQAEATLLAITGQHALLDNSPAVQRTIRFRNPYTDLLNLLQVELLRRYRHSPPDAREPLRPALFLSINGLAAAMQSTG
jgi:phosphoenolpyruvate carboxylase